MTDQPKLLPCPFCGASARLKPMLNLTEMRVEHDAGCLMYGKRHAVNHPGERMPVDAFAAWNKRAPDTEREAMARVCEAAGDMRDTYDISEEMEDALNDLERARGKGEG